ncbi:hypothetical protein ACOME3_007358 [Neoechinorhynchus agilis]
MSESTFSYLDCRSIYAPIYSSVLYPLEKITFRQCNYTQRLFIYNSVIKKDASVSDESIESVKQALRLVKARKHDEVAPTMVTTIDQVIYCDERSVDLDKMPQLTKEFIDYIPISTKLRSLKPPLICAANVRLLPNII